MKRLKRFDEKTTKQQARTALTRGKMLEVAIKAFGEVGYDGVGTRELAQRAGVNLSAIRYHFGDKQGLYRAVLQYIADNFLERMSPFLQQIRFRIDAPGTTRDELLDALCDLMSGLISQSLGPNLDVNWSRIIFREEMAPTSGHQIVFKTERQIIEVAAQIIGKIIGQRSDSERVRIRTMTVLGQVFVFMTSRAAALRAIGWRQLGSREISAVQTIVNEQCRAILTGLSAS